MQAFEDMIEAALEPGRFFHWRAGAQLVRELEAVLGQIEQVEKDGRGRQALELYEAFLAGCYAKADEVDDSGGNFAGFFDELIEHWAGTAERLHISGADIATKVSGWAEKDEYGYLDRAVETAAKAVTPESLAGFADVLRTMWEEAHRSPGPGDGTPDFAAKIAGDRLKLVLWKLGDSDAYRTFCDETEISARDCLRLAEINTAQGKLDQALEWVDEGLVRTAGKRHLDGEEHDLADSKLRLLQGLERFDEARALAWQRFEDRPSRCRYSDLMETCPDDQREEWHRRALSMAEDSMATFMEICAATQTWSSLREVLETRPDKELMPIFYGTLERLARHTADDFPEVAARLYAVLAHQILNEARAKAYHHACDYLAAARHCYRAAGMAPAWDDLVQLLQKTHFRKYRFVEGFNQVLDGSWGRPEPSFLQKARSEWPK